MKSILIIETNPSVIENLTRYFEYNRIKVTVVKEEQQGLAFAKLILPDMILCAISEPGISGYNILLELRKHNLTSKIPFLFLLGAESDLHIRNSLDLDIDSFFEDLIMRFINLMNTNSSEIEKYLDFLLLLYSEKEIDEIFEINNKQKKPKLNKNVVGEYLDENSLFPPLDNFRTWMEMQKKKRAIVH